MKLIFCPSCQDLIKLQRSKRTCACGDSWGEYADNVKATIGGLSIPIGIDNKIFVKAVKNSNKGAARLNDLGFKAFVFCHDSKNIVREK